MADYIVRVDGRMGPQGPQGPIGDVTPEAIAAKEAAEAAAATVTTALGNLNADNIKNTPFGGITTLTVQAALNQLDSNIVNSISSIPGEGTYTNSFNSQAEKKTFDLKTTAEWDANQNANISLGVFKPATANSISNLVRGLDADSKDLVIQAKVYWDNTQDSANIGYNINTAGSIESSVSQHRFAGLKANNGFVFNDGSTVTTLLSNSNLSTGWYIITFFVLNQSAGIFSIQPEGSTKGAFSTYITADSNRFPAAKNIALQAYAVTDKIKNVKFSAGSFGGVNLIVPNMTNSKNYHTPVKMQSYGVDTIAHIPASYNPDVKNRCVVYFHGAGGAANDLWNYDNENSILQHLLDAGYIVIASNYTSNQCWGNVQSTIDTENLITQYKQYLNIGDIYVVMQSMGGAVALNSISHSKIKPKAVAGIYPVCNLANMYNNGSGAYATNIQTAYSFSDTSQFDNATNGYDPLNDNDGTVFKNIPFIIWASPGDTVVNKAQNMDAFATKINDVSGHVYTNICSGDHGDPSAFNGGDIVNFFGKY